MSEHSKQWPRPVTEELTKALEGVRTRARVIGNQQYAGLADVYISALVGMTPALIRQHPDPSTTEGLIRDAAVVGDLYRSGNLRGVLQKSHAAISALSSLPGNPGSTPPVLPPPPDDD